MLNNFKCRCPVYLACGYTDLRRGIDGLAGLVQTQFRLDPFQNALFLFCGRRKDRIKGLYWEGDGFVLVYKRLESGSFQWPRNGEEARQLTPQQYRWLMEQLRLLKKKQFGASSEQTKEQLDGQLSLLFNEAEAHFTIGRQPNWSPAKRVQFGEAGQGSEMRNARRAFRIRAYFAPTRWSTA